MDDRRLDPNAPLPGPPDPWAESDMPSLRDGPPWHMTEMIEAEPALAVRILDRLAADGSAARLADSVRSHSRAGRPIRIVGCGTSEHGAMGVAAVIGEALARGAGAATSSAQAFEASILSNPENGGLVVGVSHEGGTWATIRALDAARAAGSSTALITASSRSQAARSADIVLETIELDQSWCHTVGYLSPILAAIATAAAINGQPVQEEAHGLLAAGLANDAVTAVESMASALADLDRIIVVAGGTDLVAARELVLKIEEGTHIPAAVREVETLLHGHLAATDAFTGVVAIGADSRGAAERAARVANGLRAVRELGAAATAILTPLYAEAMPDDLTPGGRVVIGAPARNLGSAARALLSTAIPLQLLTERIARVRGVNPDPIRRDDARYLRAAQAATPTS